jgi:hypothetical protein
VPLVYHQLHRAARRYMAGERFVQADPELAQRSLF